MGRLKTGDDSDWNPDIFDVSLSVGEGSCDTVLVSSLVGGFFDTDSGSSRDSILSIAACSLIPEEDLFDLDAGSLIREAGVAGWGWSVPRSIAEWLRIGPMDGDCVGVVRLPVCAWI